MDLLENGFYEGTVEISKGLTSVVYRDPVTGDCYKVPNIQNEQPTDEYSEPLLTALEYLLIEEQTHRVLRELGIPTFPEYNIEVYQVQVKGRWVDRVGRE